MIDVLRFVVGLAADVVRGHAGLVAENALLRQQLIVAQRKIAGRVRWAPLQRFTMGLAARLAPAWRTATLLVRPATTAEPRDVSGGRERRSLTRGWQL